MKHHPVELNRVVYNAADQAFEALVTVHDPSGTHSYACSIHAPIDMEFSRASAGLTTQALRRHSGASQSSYLPSGHLLPQSIS
ncbi:MAG: hypothetical protein ABJG80_05280, partial [Paracoccaceae bacterium]